MRIILWLIKAAIFFTLFAFALNNQHEVAVKWFFGLEWRASMVLVVLAVFVLGCVAGALAMLPGWWRQRRAALRQDGTAKPSETTKTTPTQPAEINPAAAREGI